MPRSMQVGSKQSGSKAVHSSALTPLGGAQALPAVGAPTPPSDALSVGPSRGKAPPSTLMVHADGAAQEVRGSPRYLQVLGSYAPPAKQVADALEFASQWYAQQ